MARLKAAGVAVKGENVRDGSGNFAHFEDPDGNELCLWETRPEKPSST
ncbi:MAG: hypothetical protein R2729_22655 [Bryobacteraceae bacterium]